MLLGALLRVRPILSLLLLGPLLGLRGPALWWMLFGPLLLRLRGPVMLLRLLGTLPLRLWLIAAMLFLLSALLRGRPNLALWLLRGPALLRMLLSALLLPFGPGLMLVVILSEDKRTAGQKQK